MRIPTGNFGNVVAQPQQGVRAPQGLGSESYNALARTGQQLQNVAEGAMADQRREEEKAQAKAEREADEARKAAIRAQSITILIGTTDGIDDDTDQVVQGVLDRTIPKDQAEAEHQKRTAARLQGVAKDLPEAEQQIVLAQLNSHALRQGNVVRKAVVQRDREDVTAGINQTLEYLQRQYVADPEKATAQAEQTVQQLLPHSTLTPDAGAKLFQSWKEGTQYTTAFKALDSARGSVKNLDALMSKLSDASVLPDLDPQKRAQLVATADGYKTSLIMRAEAEAQRRAREAEVRLNKARAEAEAAQYRMDRGQYDSPEQVAITTAALAGTPFLAGYKAGQQQAREVGGFASMPIAQQQQSVDALNARIAREGASEQLLKLRDQRQRILDASQKAAQDDPLRGLVMRSPGDSIPPIDTSSIDGLVKSMGARMQLVDRARTWVKPGTPVSPLLPEEAPVLAKMLAVLPIGQRSARLADIAQALGPQKSAALAKQLDASDKPLALALAQSTSKTMTGRLSGEWVLRGQQAIKDKSIKEDSQALTGLKTLLAAEVGEALSGKVREDVLETARLMYLGQQAEGLNPTIRGVIGLAIGGELVEHNGTKIPVSAGVGVDGLRNRLRAMPFDAIGRQAPDGFVYSADGRPQGVKDFLVGLPAARLEPAGEGRYYVRNGAGLALGKQDGQLKPITIEVR